MFSWHNIDYVDIIFFYLEPTISSHHQLTSKNISKYGKCECPLNKNKKVSRTFSKYEWRKYTTFGNFKACYSREFQPYIFFSMASITLNQWWDLNNQITIACRFTAAASLWENRHRVCSRAAVAQKEVFLGSCRDHQTCGHWDFAGTCEGGRAQRC